MRNVSPVFPLLPLSFGVFQAVARFNFESTVNDFSLDSFNSACSSLASQISIPNATLNFSQPVIAGTNLTFPSRNTTCVTINGQAPSVTVPVDICRVALFVSTSDRSGINMEAWLPMNWTGRFLSTGNGGLAGCKD